MMRDIKFRAWHKKKKKMYEVVLDTFKLVEGKIYFADGFIDDFHIDKKDIILLQSSGLKDKKGKEIYEGDILKRNNGEVGKVIYHFPDGDNNVYGFTLDTKDGGWGFNTMVFDGEVIGNIYEDKKLLK